MVSPIDRGFVAHRDRKDDVWVRIGQRDQAAHLGVVFNDAGLKLFFAEAGPPRAADVVHLGTQVGAQHELEVQTIAANDLQHTLGMLAAVV